MTDSPTFQERVRQGQIAFALDVLAARDAIRKIATESLGMSPRDSLVEVIQIGETLVVEVERGSRGLKEFGVVVPGKRTHVYHNSLDAAVLHAVASRRIADPMDAVGAAAYALRLLTPSTEADRDT